MSQYIINTKKTDESFNEIHKTTCSHLPYSWNQDKLGYFSDDFSAIAYAKINGYPDADGCAYCCGAVHHG